MAIEELRSEQLSAKTARKSYILTGYASASAARTALLAAAPTTFNGLSLRPTEVSVEEQETVDGSGNRDYIGRAGYGTPGGTRTPSPDLDTGNTRISISTAGGSVKITQSLDTVASYPNPGAADHDGAIGVTEQGPQGTTILTGGLDITITKIVDSTDLDISYLNDIVSLTTPNPHTNNATFSHTDTDGRQISLAAGEALFIGMQNTPRGDGTDELRFNFKGSANLTDALPNSPWTIVKGGWQHLWLSYEKQENGVGADKRLVSTPIAAYVEQVYESGDFSLLGL